MMSRVLRVFAVSLHQLLRVERVGSDRARLEASKPTCSEALCSVTEAVISSKKHCSAIAQWK
jgi:hypothetical protein